MNIAIMGAGLSGLSCAIYLEKHGLKPTIFEKRRLPGDRFINGEIFLHLLNKPYNDCLSYFEKEFGIVLEPVSLIEEITVFSKNKQASIKGNIGYSNIRGRHEQSSESQLAAQVKSEIIYDSDKSYDDLLHEFDRVVVATGDAEYAAKLGNYKSDLTVSLKGATVEGNFTTNNPMGWLNNNFAPQGYGFLIPFSESEATVVVAYPDYPHNRVKDPNTLYDLYYQQVCKDLSQNLKITDTFEVHGYILGICNKAKIDNTYFVGNNFGAIMPALGFGQFTSILTGVYAAQDILGMGDYDKLTQEIRHAYNNSLVLRRSLEKLDNAKLDLIVQNLNYKLVDKVFDNKGQFDYVKALSYLLRPLV